MRIGFTTSFPVEVVFAAGHIPVDLNNIFASNDPKRLVDQAEAEGFPRNICAWIKGIYQTVTHTDVDMVIGIVQGDCSNTHSLLSLFEDKKILVNTFSFPYNKDRQMLRREIEILMGKFQVSWEAVNQTKMRLDKIRRKLVYLDTLTYQEQIVTGEENHYWLLSSSDFWGDPDLYEHKLDEFLAIASKRERINTKFRLGFLGVPPIFDDLYGYIAKTGNQIIYNEIQRQFSMPQLCNDIIDQYLSFTYPYTVKERINDILVEVKRRQLDGLISYTQSFCHRAIDQLLIKKNICLPILQLEGDQPGSLDARTKLRIDSYLDVLAFR